MKPNVIMIVADDLGYGDIGAFNDGLVATPNIDRLIAEGSCFRQHYSASPICAPARAALLTGRYPQRTGAITQHEIHGLDRIALREVTMADCFAHAGYRTSLVGKWHNGTFDPRFEPNGRGYDEFVGFCGGWLDYYDYQLRRNERLHKSDGRYITDVLTDEALDFIDRNKKNPFFLHVAYSAPHSPFQAPAEIVKRYSDKGFNRIVATTYAMIEIMDAGIGRLLDKLDAEGLANNTVVLFTSDNGPAFFNPPYMLEDGEDTYNERFNAGMRGSKGWIQEGGIRVPMIVRCPEMVAAGRMSDELAHFTDWMPTLLAMCGIDRPASAALDEIPLDGHDLSPILRGEQHRTAPRQFWQWNFYYPDIGTNAAMRDGKWKLVRPMMNGTRFFNPELYVTPEDEARCKAFVENDIKHKADPTSVTHTIPVPNIRLPEPEPLELYDLEADPGESVDLAAQHPDRVYRMKTQLETWFESVAADWRAVEGPELRG